MTKRQFGVHGYSIHSMPAALYNAVWRLLIGNPDAVAVYSPAASWLRPALCYNATMSEANTLGADTEPPCRSCAHTVHDECDQKSGGNATLKESFQY